MNSLSQKLLIEQVDKKLSQLRPLENVIVPTKGWVNTIRKTLKMSLRQLAERLHISAQAAKEIEGREVEGSITLKSLRDVANALDMKLVYGFIPKQASIMKMIDLRANEIAKEIVYRTSNTMSLEDQKNTDSRIQKAIREKAEEIKAKMPKYLWD